MKLINLLPKSEQKEIQLLFFGRSQLMFWLSILMTLVIFLAATFAARFYLNSIHKQTQNEISEKQKLLQTSDNEILRAEVDGLNSQIRVIKSLQSQHNYWSNAFAELGDLFPPDMQIDLISVDRRTSKVDLVGSADSRESVIAFWSAMHKSEYFEKINFPLANLERASDSSFTFTFYVKPDKIKQE